MSTLMAVKVLGLIGLLAAFVWWQMHDLAQEKKRAEQRKAKLGDNSPNSNSQ